MDATYVGGSTAFDDEGHLVGLGGAQLSPGRELHARSLALQEELHHLELLAKLVVLDDGVFVR